MKSSLTSFSCFALLLASGCAAPSFDGMARYGTFDIDGEIGISSGVVTEQADLQQAGLQSDDSVLGARIDLDFGSPHLTLSGQASSHGGNGTLDAELNDGGVTIPAGTGVATDLDLGLYGAVVTFDMIPSDVVEFGLGVGVSGLDFDFAVRNQGTMESIDSSEFIPVPVLALRAGAEFGPVEISALLTGVAVKYDDNEVTYFDADAFARYSLIGGDDRLRGSIMLGYRYLDADAEYEDDGDEVDASFTFDGPYFGLQISL